MVLFRRLLGRLLFVAIAGWLVNKLLESEDPKAQKVGNTANRMVGGVFGHNGAADAKPRRRIARSAGSAAVGGLVSYFFDPALGHDRRVRVKTFASDRLSGAKERVAASSETATSSPVPSPI